VDTGTLPDEWTCADTLAWGVLKKACDDIEDEE